MSRLSFPWARQLLWNVPVNAGSQCDKAAKNGVRIKETPSTSVRWNGTEKRSQDGSAPAIYSERIGFNSCPTLAVMIVVVIGSYN